MRLQRPSAAAQPRSRSNGVFPSATAWPKTLSTSATAAAREFLKWLARIGARTVVLDVVPDTESARHYGYTYVIANTSL